MGIKGLTKIINKESPESIQTEQLYKLSGKRVAIDSSLFIYKYLMNVRYNGKSLETKDSKCTSHISGIFYKTILYLSLNITPIYIFDGKPPVEKNELIQDRKNKASKAKNEIKLVNSPEEKLKYEKQSIRVNKGHIDDIKKLLDLMGVEYLHMDGEAEAIASELCRINYVDYVVTEDMDTMAFGCPKLIRTCLDKSIRRNDFVSIIDLSKIIGDLKLTNEQFIELCVLCGCDYCPNIPRIGQVKALYIINNFPSVKDFLNSKHTYTVPENYLERFTKAKELFTMYHDNLNPLELNFVKKEQNIQELTNYLVKDCEISINRVQNSIKKLHNNYSNV